MIFNRFLNCTANRTRDLLIKHTVLSTRTRKSSNVVETLFKFIDIAQQHKRCLYRSYIATWGPHSTSCKAQPINIKSSILNEQRNEIPCAIRKIRYVHQKLSHINFKARSKDLRSAPLQCWRRKIFILLRSALDGPETDFTPTPSVSSIIS